MTGWIGSSNPTPTLLCDHDQDEVDMKNEWMDAIKVEELTE